MRHRQFGLFAGIYRDGFIALSEGSAWQKNAPHKSAWTQQISRSFEKDSGHYLTKKIEKVDQPATFAAAVLLPHRLVLLSLSSSASRAKQKSTSILSDTPIRSSGQRTRRLPSNQYLAHKNRHDQRRADIRQRHPCRRTFHAPLYRKQNARCSSDTSGG